MLTERQYLLHDKEYGDHSVFYAVGQPMGAYSSFPMLGLTHHFIVQLAFRRVISRKAMYATSSEIYLEDKIVATFNKRKELLFSSGWYENYELLGDDIVIFNGEVASEYLVLMRDLGLEINMSKSVVSKNKTFEFAKITGHRGHDVSALP